MFHRNRPRERILKAIFMTVVEAVAGLAALLWQEARAHPVLVALLGGLWIFALAVVVVQAAR